MAESDAKALVPRAERIVDFYGDAIPVALVDDVPYVALRMFADYLGLDWSAQRRRTERDEVLASEVRTVFLREELSRVTDGLTPEQGSLF